MRRSLARFVIVAVAAAAILPMAEVPVEAQGCSMYIFCTSTCTYIGFPLPHFLYAWARYECFGIVTVTPLYVCCF